ncbi:hypothetical protein LZ198_15130 [Myxococcus sp. K15C18031901]|uniref:hypothetical protein n=1 Tax=Myxococcus dinghuensis TaxID=2906761 RepID=UPI0020A7D510|nr:hypothetical protein [Myxococcus dinghuensis]MCP3100204.1 hypothetical protein [Myxococcus dinghuensis]
MKLQKRTSAWRSCALTGALLLPAVGLADETHVYGIANFGSPAAGLCEADTHPVHTKTASAFVSYFFSLIDAGKWTDARSLNNTFARADLFTDAAKAPAADARDTSANAGVDDADVIFVHTHGGHSEANLRSWLVMGSSMDACSAVTDLHMRLGNGKLDIAVIKACQSGDYQVWKQGGYRTALVTSTSGFTLWNAFHGNSSCGDFVTSYVKRYAANSKSAGVGENWIDEAYDKDSGTNDDDCPVSIVFGDTQARRVRMFESGGWRDRHDTGAKVASTYFYVGGCDPSGGQVLPE